MEDDFDQYGGLSREHSELINKHNNKIETLMILAVNQFFTDFSFFALRFLISLTVDITIEIIPKIIKSIKPSFTSRFIVV